MITVDQLPEKAIDAARIAMAEALARDGDGIPECIAAAINAWPGMIVGNSLFDGEATMATLPVPGVPPMTDIPIPAAALEAGARAAHNFAYKIDAADDPDQWDDMPDAYKENMRKEARAAFEAMVGAWPGMYRADWNDKNELDPVIILPLTETSTKENDNG